MNETPPSARRRAYARLMAQAGAATGDARWHLLMAAHVLGQPEFRLHLHSHWRMLGQAASDRDPRELLGQVLRLLLVPAGHALSRLPTGNVGRATVSAFRPMVPPPEVQAWVRWALHER